MSGATARNCSLVSDRAVSSASFRLASWRIPLGSSAGCRADSWARLLEAIPLEFAPVRFGCGQSGWQNVASQALLFERDTMHPIPALDQLDRLTGRGSPRQGMLYKQIFERGVRIVVASDGYGSRPPGSRRSGKAGPAISAAPAQRRHRWRNRDGVLASALSRRRRSWIELESFATRAELRSAIEAPRGVRWVLGRKSHS